MSTTPASIIGRPTPRIDGPLKTTGAAQYAADFHFEGMAHAVPVVATQLPAAVSAHSIHPPPKRCPACCSCCITATSGRCIGPFPAMTTQPTAKCARHLKMRSCATGASTSHVVVAETLEQATAAAAAVHAEYDAEPAKLRPSLDDYTGKRKKGSERGDFDARIRRCAGKDRSDLHHARIETHNPIELHASVAVWEGDRITMYETSQGVVNHRVVMAQTLGIPVENVRVVTRFLGSGFGGKLFPWPHCAMTAVAARKLGPSGEAECHSPHDVLERRLPSAHRATHPSSAHRRMASCWRCKQDYLNVTFDS